MPTKHIDDATAAQLDDLYVRCVTLTQQPVKEVEVLRLAIQTGIGNITDNDILSTLSVKDTVWKRLAEQCWSEVATCWPEDAIGAFGFEKLACEYSETWQQLAGERCHTAMTEQLKNQLFSPIFSTTQRLFTANEFEMSEEEYRAAKEHDAQLDVQYRENLSALAGRLYSTLDDHEKILVKHYRRMVSFTPEGNGDFVVQLAEDRQ